VLGLLLSAVVPKNLLIALSAGLIVAEAGSAAVRLWFCSSSGVVMIGNSIASL
jgi:hypothetical protein